MMTSRKKTENANLSPLADPFLSMFDTKTLGALSSSCLLFYEKFSKELNIRKRNELIRRIICGEEEAAKTMLDLYPELLRDKEGKAIDYFERKIENLTPLQVALCAGDKDMCEMMKKIFLANPEKTGGFGEMESQFNEIFPAAQGGFEGHLKKQKENGFDFSKLVNAISQANDDELKVALSKEGASFTQTIAAQEKPYDQLTLTEKLNHFREEFAKKSLNEIVFNPQHLLCAFEVYEDQFYGWDLDRRNLFWRQVIGFVQRFLPACDAQAFAQGIYYLTEKNQALKRSFNFRDGGCFYPVDFNSCSSLGFDYTVGANGLRGGVVGVGWPSYKVYFEQKHITWKTYADQPAATDPFRNFIK